MSAQTGGVKRPAAEAAASASADKKARSDDGDYKYMSGFGNEFSTEALKGALPIGQNSPQVVRAQSSFSAGDQLQSTDQLICFAVPIWPLR